MAVFAKPETWNVYIDDEDLGPAEATINTRASYVGPDHVGPMVLYAELVRKEGNIEYLYVYNLVPENYIEGEPPGSHVIQSADGKHEDYHLLVRRTWDWESSLIERWLQGGPDVGVGHPLHHFERVSPGAWKAPSTKWAREIERNAKGYQDFGVWWFTMKGGYR